MQNFDIKDKKLLYYLSINARTSHTQLSRKIGLSKNAVKYRIERLLKQGIIKNFSAVVNIGALKLSTFTLMLKFNDDIYENPEILDYFKNHDFSNWVAVLAGQWDIFVEFVYKDVGQICKIIDDMIVHFSGKLNKYKTHISEEILRVEHLMKDFYKDIKVEEVAPRKRTKERYDVDMTDRRIMHLLCQDSSLHYLKIAQKLGLSIDIVRYRMRNLQEKGLLIKFSSEISLKKLGYTTYLYRIQLSNASQVKTEEIKKSIQVNNDVTYAFYDVLTSTLIFDCAFRNADGIDYLSRTLRKNFGDIIETQEYYIVKEQVLFNLFPKGLLDE